ncbi:MAG: alpha/beta hydrolase [Candidatus Babeliales bacterium]
MKNIRIYGKPPFNVAVVHGGPGGAGEVATVAKELSTTRGVLEPLQTKSTIEGQLEELKSVVQENGTLPLTLIGYSWGAWLSFIFAAQNPSLVKKLILISSGPFEASYATNIMKTRLGRLTEQERSEIDLLWEKLKSPTGTEKNKAFAQLEVYISMADAYDPLPSHNEALKCHYDIYESIWPEAAELRRSGKLLALGKQIQCPVVAIHGDYDPHPAQGVQKPLSNILKNFRFILIENCGHKPWIERGAQEKFYKLLKEELEEA